ncbi:MAG: hypothetical protein LQ339_005004 [Xanthoria mediterranea]|nr:MAG: hypothetical protein LQ339_005004 [Xanthoria mediterranea]
MYLKALLACPLIAATVLGTTGPGKLQPRHYSNDTNGSQIGPIKPKVFLINLFTPEAAVFYNIPEFNLLERNITVPGFSPKFPDAHCTANGDICQLVTGEGEINAAATVSSLVLDKAFDLRSTYFLIAGIAGVNPEVATTASVLFARFEVQVALQYEFDIRDIGSNFSTGYIPYNAKVPGEYPTTIYGTEVFEVNDALRSLAILFAKKAQLNDSAIAQGYRAKYALTAATSGPSVVACDGATSDVYYTGSILSSAFANFTKLITNGTATYCSTAQEDSAILESLLRATKAKLVDFSRIIVMRTASDFDRPPPEISAYNHFFFEKSDAFDPAVRNLYLAGREIIGGIVGQWEGTFAKGIKPTNYIGDIFGSIGGIPDFGEDQDLLTDVLGLTLICVTYNIDIFLASSQHLPPTNLSTHTPPIPPDPKRSPNILAPATRNHSLQLEGCYGPAPSLSYVTAQDGIIALGALARSEGFYRVRSWHSAVLLAQWETVGIYLVKVGTGTDFFSIYQATVQAMDILWQCVMFWPEPYGGALPVGSRDVFRVVVQK